MIRIFYKFLYITYRILQGFLEKIPWNQEVNKSFSEGLSHRGDVKFVSKCLFCFMVE